MTETKDKNRNYLKPLILRGEKIVEENILMAPLAGVTDVAFRNILKEMGASLTYTEMVSAKALHYKNEKTKNLLNLAPKEDFVAVQLFGSEPEILGEIAAMLNEIDEIKIIDINMGCPAPKLVKNGEGAALMTKPEIASRIIRAVRKNTSKPVTCKFRRGFEVGDETALNFAKMAEDSGADMVTLHGRYRDQFYSGQSDRKIISRVKKELKIPVIGNGDIFSLKDAVDVFETGCDGIMIARGALGNPYIFKEILSGLRGEEYIPPTDSERVRMALRHLKDSCQYLGENIAVREMRKHLAWYLKGLKNSTRIKDSINKMTRESEVAEVLSAYSEELSL